MRPLLSLLPLLLSAAVPVALAHVHGVREAERVLSATDSFAVLKLVPQQTDNAMVRRAFRRIALDIHPDKACDQHDTACIRAVGSRRCGCCRA